MTTLPPLYWPFYLYPFPGPSRPVPRTTRHMNPTPKQSAALLSDLQLPKISCMHLFITVKDQNEMAAKLSVHGSMHDAHLREICQPYRKNYVHESLTCLFFCLSQLNPSYLWRTNYHHLLFTTNEVNNRARLLWPNGHCHFLRER